MAAAAYSGANLTGGLLSDVMGGLVPGFSGGLLDGNAQPQPQSAPAPAPNSAPQAATPQVAADADPISRLIAQNRPSRLQTLLHAWGTGQDFNTAQADLTERNIKNRMLPAKIAADLRDAQINAALAGRELGALQGGQGGASPGGAPTMAPAVAPRGAAAGVQTASAAGAPTAPSSGAPPAPGGMPFSRDLLQILALRGVPGAAAAYQIGAPKYAVDRTSGRIFDENTGQFNGQGAPRAQYVNSQLVHPYDDNAPAFVPQYAAGTMPDGKGGVIPIPGYANAQAELAGKTEAAKQAAAGPYDTVTINVNGVPTVVSKSQLAQMQGIVPGFAGGAPSAPQQAGTAPQTAPAPQSGARTLTPQQAMQFYVAKGYKPDQAAGIVGNLIGESGLNPTQTADDGSYGLAQWTGPRLQGLFAFAKRNKLDPSDPNTQLEYSHFELQNGEKASGDAIRSAGNVNDATAAAVGYERPAGYTPQNPQGASGFDRRLAAAQQLASGSAGSPTQPATAGNGVIAQGVNPETLATDQDALKTLRNDVAEKRYIAGKANEFVQKMGNLATGPGYGIGIGPVNVKSIAELVPGGNGTLLQDLDAITNQAWVHLRPQGSGSLRGPEIDSFKEAFPNTENLGQANVDIANRLSAEAKQAEQELAFKESWLQQHGTLTGADAAWAKIPVAHNATVGQAQAQGTPSRRVGPKLPPRAPALPRAVTIDPRAIADLKRDPSPQAQAEFDQVFGAGSAKRALGGA